MSEKRNGFGDYEGVIVEIGKTMSIGSKGFVKREVVVDSDPDAEYPNPVRFTFKKDRTGLLDKFRTGERVRVGYVIEGRRWDNPAKGPQYFVDLVGLKIEAVVLGVAEDMPEHAEAPEQVPAASEDLPF